MGPGEDPSGVEGMVFAMHPDQAVRDSIIRIKNKVEGAKKKRSWRDELKK